MSALKVVCIGGGLGAPTVRAGLRAHTEDITGLIAVTDSGRSMALLADRRPRLRALS